MRRRKPREPPDHGRRGPLSARRCGGWSATWCCKCSTRPGRTTCWRWTTSAAASACAATPRSIPRWNTSARGCGFSRQMWESVGERVDRPGLPHGAARRGVRRLDLDRGRGDPRGRPSAGEIAAQQQAAIEGTQTDHKPQPIRNRQQRVGRNDPCPCGSGKKFKNCCMRKG